MTDWNHYDTVECYKRGWGIFHTDNGYQLQALDDPDTVELDEEINIAQTFGGPNRDQDAARVCQQSANDGDPVARKAIEFLIEQESPDVFEFGLEITW